MQKLSPWLIPVLLMGLIAFFVVQNPSTVAQGGSGYIDVHMHLDGVMQRGGSGPGGPGMGPGVGPRNPMMRRKMMERRKQMMQKRGGGKGGGERDYLPAADTLVSMMNDFGVQKSVVMPPPQLSSSSHIILYSDLFDAVDAYPDRLALGAGGGVLNPMIHDIPASEVTDADMEYFAAQANQMIEDGAHVFGEMTAMHLCMNPKHHYIAAPPDHPLFLLLADIAAENNIPIDLHMEVIAERMQTPRSIADACSKNPSMLPATIPPLESLLEHNRKANIVWQHIGWDNTGQMKPDILGKLLAKHPNLFLAIKGVPGESKHPQPNRIHDDNYEILPEWLELLRDFPDQIMVGADEFANAGITGGGGYRKPPFFNETWSVIEGLPEDIQQKVGRENAARIYNL